MILVTGATGFIGSHLLPKLHQQGHLIRVLLPPEGNANLVPKNIPVEIAVCSLNDEHNLSAALKSVKTIIHLASDEIRGQNANLTGIDISGTETLLRVCQRSSVQQILLVSHIGAEPASAYPVYKTKGIIEQAIINSGLTYSILKTGPVFGNGDHFLNKIHRYLKTIPLISFIPDKGQSITHPIWVDDLVTAVVSTIQNPLTINQTISIGGPSYYTLGEVFSLAQHHFRLRQLLFPIPSSTLRIMLLFWQIFFKNTPISSFDIDQVAVNRTAPIDNITKVFGILPYSLEDYLSK